jgi:hypothetical protein
MAIGKSPVAKNFSFGGCSFGKTSKQLAQLSSDTPMLNITLSFEDALKLHLAIGECVSKLNSHNRATTAGRRSALNLAVHLNKRRITVNESKL